MVGILKVGINAAPKALFGGVKRIFAPNVMSPTPVPVKRERQQSLSIRWILIAIRSKAGRPTFQRLADELIAASRREGEAMSKREQTVKMAEANKAFSHFAW